MAAAEYYSNAPMGPTQQSSPYLRPQHTQPHQQQQQLPTPPSQQMHTPQSFGSSTPQYPPPPYQAVQPDTRPTVHFEDRPARPQRHSFSSQAPIPVLSDQQSRPTTTKPNYSPQLRPSPVPPHTQSQPQSKMPSYSGVPPYQAQAPARQPNLQPHPPSNPQYLSPYAHTNQSLQSTNGYASDPESHRRRRRRHSNDHRDSRRSDRSARGERDSKDRSRSTNADGFIGAAGGGLIGDLIFPGLGTVGGAVVGWLGGKDYGKHRKYREDRLEKDQEKWEHKFRGESDDRGSSRRDREYRSYERHKYDH